MCPTVSSDDDDNDVPLGREHCVLECFSLTLSLPLSVSIPYLGMYIRTQQRSSDVQGDFFLFRSRNVF